MAGYDVESHYDEIAKDYDQFEKYNPRKHILIGRHFKVLGSLRGKSVLDLGCGNGFFSRLAKKKGAKYILGVDISGKQIEIATKKSKSLGIIYKKENILNLRLNRRFDFIVAGFVFNYASNKKMLQDMIRIAYKHLKKKGQMFCILCNPENPLRKGNVLYQVSCIGKLRDAARLKCEFFDKKGDYLCYDYKYYWSKKTIESILKKQGFQSLEWIEVKHISKKNSRIPKLPSTNIILHVIK